MQVNITNGFYFNEYMKKRLDGVFIPFNEVLINGELLFPLFDQAFLEKRIHLHGVTEKDYLAKMDFFFQPDAMKNYDEITLWFGLDAFCQVNMLALLAYLEQIGYKGKIFYQAIDDASFEVVETKTELVLGEFLSAYQQLQSAQPSFTKYPFVNNGINDYLYVKNKDNHFYRYIKENLGKVSDKQLLIDLLKDSAKFGLSDAYLQKMINEVALSKLSLLN